MIYAEAKNFLVSFIVTSTRRDGDDHLVVVGIYFFKFSFLGDIQIEGSNAELGQAIVVLAAAPDAGDLVVKRDEPLAKRFADIAAADDQCPHAATVSLGQGGARIILDFAGCKAARTFCGGT
jgi:hypothetical protein